MESQYFGHEHPKVFNEEHSRLSTQATHCTRCGGLMSGPSFTCVESGFYIHKQCAEAPCQINHPFHCKHPLSRSPNPPENNTGSFACNFCGETGQMFTYHCSCNLVFHIKCALFTYNIAQKNLGELKQIDCKYTSTYPDDGRSNKEVETAVCFGCWESLSGSVYYSFSCGFNLHKKCAELPSEIIYPGHHKHPLILQFNGENFPCMICQETDQRGLFYCCSPCKFVIHIRCLSAPAIIKDKSHPHPYNLFLRQVSFTCDACGVKGNCVPYMCSDCNLLVHKNCISLPRIIKFTWHEHVIYHTYFLQKDESKNWGCVLCRNEVDTEHGSYYCSDCHFIVHVNCIIPKKDWLLYDIIEADQLDDYMKMLTEAHMNSFIVIEKNESEEATKIKHFSHDHILMLSDKIVNEGDKYCDGCTLPISDSFYHCLQCTNFFLHRKCAEFAKRRHVWFNSCQRPVDLLSDFIFKCSWCEYVCNGFAYKCDECREYTCLRCMISDHVTCEGHEHELFFHCDFQGQCKACTGKLETAYICKQCNFCLDYKCLVLPLLARHKCDEHPLKLTYHEVNTYEEYHFCDICEEYRNPSCWFYHCAICDTCAHSKCVLGEYSFIKLGKTYKEWTNHPHPLTFVKKTYYYPKCFECGEPCQDLALECEESGCQYLVHWGCIPPSYLGESS